MKSYLPVPLVFVLPLIFLSACQTTSELPTPQQEVSTSESEVCIGDPLIIGAGESVDLEAMAKQVDCP